MSDLIPSNYEHGLIGIPSRTPTEGESEASIVTTGSFLTTHVGHVKRVPYHVFTNMNAVMFVKTRNGVSKNVHVPARLDISASLWARTRKVKAERIACHPCPRFHRVCGLSWEREDCTDKSNGLNIDGQMMKRMAYH
jgi:hypothetical protein